MADTYRDGVQMERCLFCGGAVRDMSNAPMVLVKVTDLEDAVIFLEAELLRPAPLVLAFEQALGRTVKQIQAARDESEAIPSHVRTDRGGLET